MEIREIEESLAELQSTMSNEQRKSFKTLLEEGKFGTPSVEVKPITKEEELTLAQSVVVDRECGSCTECCKSLGVNARDDNGELVRTEFFSEPGEWCQHCDVGAGCKIYDLKTKPRECHTFFCLWRLGLTQSTKRPDSEKCVLAPENTGFGETMMVWERWQEIERFLVLGFVVIVAHGNAWTNGTRTIYLPREVLNNLLATEEGKELLAGAEEQGYGIKIADVA
jgi:hypothetical protein